VYFISHRCAFEESVHRPFPILCSGRHLFVICGGVGRAVLGLGAVVGVRQAGTPTSQYFSPGICPSGYSVGCSSLNSISTLTETRALCCPAGFTGAPRTAPTDWLFTVGSTLPCTIDAPQETWIITITTLLSSAVFQTSTTCFSGLNAYGVSIHWQAIDFTTNYFFLLPHLPHIEADIKNISNFLFNPYTNTTTKYTLKRAKAGVGVGVTLFVLFCVLGLGYFLIKRRKATQASELDNTGPAVFQGKP
jgi:hypothetical protein